MDAFKTKKSTDEEINKQKNYIFLSILVPLVIILIKPFGMSFRQSAVSSLLLLVIIWWCTGIVSKTISSCTLILGFAALSAAPLKTILAFPLSETFPLIALTYLFSRGVVKSTLAERYLETLLYRHGNTPTKSLLLVGLMFILTVYAIPQPLARLIIVADIIKIYLDKTDADSDLKSTMLFGAFLLYIFINMMSISADLILNSTTVAVSGISFSDYEWIKYMLVPSAMYLFVVLILFFVIFRKTLHGRQLKIKTRSTENNMGNRLSGKEKIQLTLIILTIIMWLSEPFHGIPNWIITLLSVVLMFITGSLKAKDLKAIDIPMILFLTAAMSIGGVMSSCGIADIIFSRLRSIIFWHSELWVIFAIMLITICMHMILGSNTTTVSVVIPGIIFLCKGLIPTHIVMLIVYISSASQWIFPFHSLALMMGNSKNYFSVRHIVLMGIPMLVLVFLAMFFLYIPWWKYIG